MQLARAPPCCATRASATTCPVVEVIQPAVRRAVARHAQRPRRRHRHARHRHQRRLRRRVRRGARHHARAAGLPAVRRVRRGRRHRRRRSCSASRTTTSTRSPTQGVDTLVLGCTHYPLLTGVISYVMGEDVTLVSAAPTRPRKDVYRTLVAHGLERDAVAARARAPVPRHGRPRALHRPRPPLPRPRGRRGRARRRGRCPDAAHRSSAARAAIPVPTRRRRATSSSTTATASCSTSATASFGALQRYVDVDDIDAVRALAPARRPLPRPHVATTSRAATTPTARAARSRCSGPPGTADRMARAYDLPPEAGMHGEFDVPRPRRRSPRSGRSAITHRARRTTRSRPTRIACRGGRSLAGVQRRHRREPTPSSSSRRGADLALFEASLLSRYDNLPPDLHLTGDAGRRARARAPASAGSCSPTSCPGRPRERDAAPRPRRCYDGDAARCATAGLVARGREPRRLGSRRMTRSDGRAADQLRPVTFQRGWLDHAEGSCLVVVRPHARAVHGVVHRRACRAGARTPGSAGSPASTRCCRAPPTRATTASRSAARSAVARTRSRASSGRSLRAAIDLSALGENSIMIDCDVLQADGGTRTAAITGAYVALADADRVGARARATSRPARSRSSARSPRSASASSTASRASTCTTTTTSRADTDMNVVMTGDGRYVEVQGTAEGEPFDRALLDELLALAAAGCAELTRLQIDGAGAVVTHPASSSPRATRTRSRRWRRILDDAGLHVEVVGIDAFDGRARGGRDRGRASRATRCSRRGPSAPPPACRPSPTTPGCASTRSTACPACSRRGGAAAPRRRRQPRAGARPARRHPRRAAGRAVPVRRGARAPRRPRGRGARRDAGPARARAARHRTASATTRSSCRTARRAPAPS